MSAPVLTLSTASSPSSSSPYIASSAQGTPPHTTSSHNSIDPDRHPLHALATLSRNASVISTSSSSSSSSSVTAPIRPRPIRTFSRDSTSTARARSPPNNLHSGYPRSPTTPTRGTPIPAAYLPRALSPDPLRPGTSPPTPSASRPASRAGSRAPSRPPNSRSRSNSAVQQQPRALTADDFDFGEILGTGSYSSVMSAVNRHNGQTYAVKIIDKAHIIRYRKVKYANIEKMCLVRLGTGQTKGNPNAASSSSSVSKGHQHKVSGMGGAAAGHPGVIKMHYTFHDDTSLYFVLDLAPNGELNSLIRKLGSFSYTMVKYYTAQLVDTLEYIHNMNILHRDVKPENVLLDAERRIKVTDFGSAKILDEEKPGAGQGQGAAAGTGEGLERASSFVGSSLYVSPELLTHSLASKGSDVWALGSIIYYMIAGDPPFKSMSEYLTFEKIKKCDYVFPPDDSEHAFDPEAKDLIEKIFNLDCADRITTQQIRAHPFLSSVNWATLWTDPAPAPESGTRKPPPPPPRMSDVFDDEDDDGDDEGDVQAMWDKFVGRHQLEESDEEEEEGGPLAPVKPDGEVKLEKEDPELMRVRRMYGNLSTATAGDGTGPHDMEKPKPSPSACPVVVEEAEDESGKEDGTTTTVVAPLDLGPSSIPVHHVLSPVVEEEQTPRIGSGTIAETVPVRRGHSGFVVVSRMGGHHSQSASVGGGHQHSASTGGGHHQHSTSMGGGRSVSPNKKDRRVPPPSIDPSVASSASVPPPPGSASSSVTSSEGSPLEPVSAHQHSSSVGSHQGLGLFTRVWGRGTRRGSTSSTTGGAGGAGGGPGEKDNLGLSVWSRRASFGNSNAGGGGGRRLSPDTIWGTISSRRMSNTSGGHGGSGTRSSSNSRRGSRSGSVIGGGGARGEMGKWSSMFLPGEQVVYHSSVQSRTRHGLLPSKRRILVLTDLPRLLVVKEYPARPSASPADSSAPPPHVIQMPFAGDVVVKSEILFSATTSTTRPPILSKISEQSGETSGAQSGETTVQPSGEEQLDSSTDEAAVPPSRPSRRPSFVRGNSASRVSVVGSAVLRSAEVKSERCFVLKTTLKTFTLSTDDADTTSQWVREIEEARSSMQNDLLAVGGIPTSA